MPKVKKTYYKWKRRMFPCLPNVDKLSDDGDENNMILPHIYREPPWYDQLSISDSEIHDPPVDFLQSDTKTLLAKNENSNHEENTQLLVFPQKQRNCNCGKINTTAIREGTKAKNTPKGILTLQDSSAFNHVDSGRFHVLMDSLFWDLSDESHHSDQDVAGENLNLDSLKNMLEDLEEGKITSSFTIGNSRDSMTKTAVNTESEDMFLSLLFEDSTEENDKPENGNLDNPHVQKNSGKTVSIGDASPEDQSNQQMDQRHCGFNSKKAGCITGSVVFSEEK